MMSDYGEGQRKPPTPVRHIDEQVEIFRKQLLSYSKTFHKLSSELPLFIYKNRMIQSDILNDFYEQSSVLQGLLREIMDEDISGETIESTYCRQCNNDPEEEEEE